MSFLSHIFLNHNHKFKIYMVRLTMREAVWSLLLSLLAGWVEMIAVTGQLRKLCQS